jgi:hypothetical protein
MEAEMTRPYAASPRTTFVAVLTLTVGSLATPGIVAAASEPNSRASCMGLELASISPPGSSDEEPGGAPQFTGEVKGLAASLGLRPGALFSFIAHLHAGSHAVCDEVLEE